MKAKLILLSAAGVCAGCAAAAAAAAPRTDTWVSYQGLIYSRETIPNAQGATQEHGDGFVPQFRVRLRRPAGSPGTAPLIDVEPDAGFSSGANAALLLRIATLDMPSGAGASSGYFRSNRAWRWRYERIQNGAREVATEVDLLSDSASSAAELCRRVELRTAGHSSSDRCRIEAIIDLADGWPLTAEVSRRMASADGSTVSQTITFERLAPE